LAGLVALRWSSVLAARGGIERNADAAFGKLCRSFQPAVLAYIKLAAPSANADDVARDFFAQLQKRRTEAANHALRGRLRLYLRSALADFMKANVKGGRSATKPGAALDRVFDTAWAQVLIERSLTLLEAETRLPVVPPAIEQLTLPFNDIKPYLTNIPTANDYARLAATLKLPTNSIAVAIQRLKLRLNELLKAQVADTLLDPNLLGPEFGALRNSFF